MPARSRPWIFLLPLLSSRSNFFTQVIVSSWQAPVATAASSSQTHNRLPLYFIALFPETTAFVSKPELSLLQLRVSPQSCWWCLLKPLSPLFKILGTQRARRGFEPSRQRTIEEPWWVCFGLCNSQVKVKHEYSFVKAYRTQAKV